MFEQLIPSFTNLVFLFMRSIHIYSCYGYLHCLILCILRIKRKTRFVKDGINCSNTNPPNSSFSF